MDYGENTVNEYDGWVARKNTDPLKHIVVGEAIHGGTFAMPVITHVKDNLWHGGFVYGIDLGDRFDTIVSLYPWETWPTKGKTIAYEMYDGWEVDVPVVMAAAKQVKAALDRGEKVLVHCQAGLNRSSLVVATVLIQDGMEPDDAIALLREKRSPTVLCNQTFERWLKAQ